MPVCLLEDRTVVHVSGPDARTFLQGLVSNDVMKAAPDTAVWCALLTPQGKYLYDFFVLGDEDGLLLDVRTDDTAALIKKLSMFKLRAKIALVDMTGDYAVYAGFDAMPPASGANVRQFADPRLPNAGWRALVATSARTEFEAAVGGIADIAEYERHRTGLGLPAAPVDLVAEKSILLEAGFDELNGVDWKKGCYMGQELTARTKYRGLVKKRLVPVRIEGPAPAPETPVLDGERNVGEMRSHAGAMGMALLRLDAIRAGRRLHANGASLVPVTPTWMVLPAAEAE